jgi:hypothetical protein
VTNSDSLYQELRPQIEALIEPVLKVSKLCLNQRGGFLPHGAVLTAEEKIILVGASVAGEDVDTLAAPADLLPTLHEGMRETVRESGGVATAVSEDVTIHRDGMAATRAIKVLFEHQRGLAVALYIPFLKPLFRGYQYLPMISTVAQAEVNAWSKT